MIADDQDFGLEDIITTLQQNRHCPASVLASESVEIGEWDDNAIYNRTGHEAEKLALFKKEK